MSTIANSYSTGLEAVGELVANYHNFDDSFQKMFEPTKKHPVSRELYRKIFKRYPGGAAGKHIANGGTMSVGTGPVFDHFTAGFIYTHYAFGISQEQIDLSRLPEQARVNVFKELVDDVTKVLTNHANSLLFNDGTGVLTGGASSIPSATTAIFAGATDGVRTNRVFPGMQVDVWDSALTSKRANGPFKITAVDYTTNTVTFSAAPTTLSVGDRITFTHLAVYGPSGPTTGSSTWPGGATSSADGLTGDSFMHGLEYVNNITKSYYLGKATASYPELVPSYEDGSALAGLTYEIGESLKNKIIQTRPDEVGKLMGVMHPKRRLDLQRTGMSIVRDMAGSNPTLKDLMPRSEYGEVFNYCGLPCLASSRADTTRVDFFIKGNWSRIEAAPTGFLKNPGNQSYIFENRSNDLVANAWSLFVVQGMDYLCEDPNASGFIYGLPAV